MKIANPDCPDCVEHESGCCWSCKMKYMRSGSVAVNVPKAFRQDQTAREIRDEIYAGARASGRDITRVRG